MVNKIKSHLETCPLLSGGTVTVDYVGGLKMTYTIDTIPCDPVITRYVDGGSKKQYQFAIMSNEFYDEDARVMIENSNLYQAIEEWMEGREDADDLPSLGTGKEAFRYEVVSKGYLYDLDGERARYRIECRLIYTQL